MRLVICGSASFYKEKIKIKQNLAKFGVEGVLDKRDEQPDKEQVNNKIHDFEVKKGRLITAYYSLIAGSDGVLVVNFDKNRTKNYIGANTFLEMGYAYVLNKRIYILNSLPSQKYIADEIKTFKPIILNNDLGKISY